MSMRHEQIVAPFSVWKQCTPPPWTNKYTPSHFFLTAPLVLSAWNKMSPPPLIMHIKNVSWWGMRNIYSSSVSEKNQMCVNEAWKKLSAINAWKEYTPPPHSPYWTKNNPLLPIYYDPAPCNQYQLCETICQSLPLPYACTWKKINYPLHVQKYNPLRLIFYIPKFNCFYNFYKKCHSKAWKNAVFEKT